MRRQGECGILWPMKLTLNKEYAQRHLFVALLLAGLSCWFGYDGFVKYPATDAAALYREIEKSEPPPQYDLEKFKAQKTQTQYGFTLLTLLAALVVGTRLYRSYAFDFSFDDTGFAVKGRRYALSDIASVDRRRWQAKGILVLSLADGRKVQLDAWHHVGVKDFAAKLPPAA